MTGVDVVVVVGLLIAAAALTGIALVLRASPSRGRRGFRE